MTSGDCGVSDVCDASGVMFVVRTVFVTSVVFVVPAVSVVRISRVCCGITLHMTVFEVIRITLNVTFSVGVCPNETHHRPWIAPTDCYLFLPFLVSVACEIENKPPVPFPLRCIW